MAPLLLSPYLPANAMCNVCISYFKIKTLLSVVLRRCGNKEEILLKGMLLECYNDDERDAIRSLDLLYRRVEHQGPQPQPLEAEDTLLRVDFVREVDTLLKEVRLEQDEAQTAQGLDPESVASRLKQREKQRTIRQVETLLDLAINLAW